MTDENKIVEVKNECFCKSKWFRKFLAISLGTFVGVFSALSLFAVLHKPPMPPCPFARHLVPHHAIHCKHHCNHHKMHDRDFYHKKIMKDAITPDKVKVEIKS